MLETIIGIFTSLTAKVGVLIAGLTTTVAVVATPVPTAMPVVESTVSAQVSGTSTTCTVTVNGDVTYENNETLTGYRIDGTAHIVARGAAYARMLKELHKKEIGFTASRVIEGIHTGKKSRAFEIAFPEHVAIYKVTAHMIAEIGPGGTVMGERL